MPLLDHVRPPILNKGSWEGFHGMWPAMMVMDLCESTCSALRLIQLDRKCNSAASAAALSGNLAIVPIEGPADSQPHVQRLKRALTGYYFFIFGSKQVSTVGWVE